MYLARNNKVSMLHQKLQFTLPKQSLMKRTFKALITTLSVLTVNSAYVGAQTFVPSTAINFTYGDPSVARPAHTSCYSTRDLNTAFGPVDIYLAGWSAPGSGGTSEFTWTFTNPNDPTTIVAQDHFMYYGVNDIEVSQVGHEILVAYYQTGVGHMVDIYNITSSTTTPVVYVSTTPLSSTASYGPIQMDGLKAGVSIIAWVNPGVGIQTVVYDWTGFGGTSTLTGTGNERALDIAISNTQSSGANVHYAYYDPATSVITEAQVDLVTLSSPPAFITPVINDPNFIGTVSAGTFDLVLDCPDAYDVDNWAYTYATNTNDVSVRFVDYHTTGVPTTVVVNSGAVAGAAPTTGYKVFSPAIQYGTGNYGFGNGDQIYVGWYISDGNAYNGYVAMHMREDASSLLSVSDYLELPNAITPSLYPFIDVIGAGVAFSKVSYGGTVPDYMYTTYYDYDGSNYILHHAFHKWGDVFFRPVTSQPVAQLTLENKIQISPNPFSDALQTSVSLKEAGKVQLKLYDMTGRTVWQYQSALPQGQHRLTLNNVKDIVPGTYVLAAFVNDAKIGTQTMVKK